MESIEAVVARQLVAGETRLESFTSEELVAVGADGPVGTVSLPPRLAQMGTIALTAALASALRSLVARGLVHPDGAASEPEVASLTQPLDPSTERSDRSDESGAHQAVSVPLSGDLAIVVALRRSAAVVGFVSIAGPADLQRLGALAHSRHDAIVHGVHAGPKGPVGVLEERRSTLGVHRFVLSGLKQCARRWCEELEAACAQQGPSGTCQAELAIDLSPARRRERVSTRLLVRLERSDTTALGSITERSASSGSTIQQLPLHALADHLEELLAAQLLHHDGNALAHLSAS